MSMWKNLGRIGEGNSLADRIGSIELAHKLIGKLLGKPKNGSKPDIPQNMLLRDGLDSGFFFGGLNQFGYDKFVGIPTDTEGNILVIGGNGSGKSSGIAVPTMQRWGGGFVATDIKGELSDAYAKMYEDGTVTRPFIVFDPMDENSLGYDPFWLLKQDDEADHVGDLLQLAYALMPILPNDVNEFWTESERGMLAAALWRFYKLPASFSDTMIRIAGTSLSKLASEIASKMDHDNDVVAMILMGETSAMKPEMIASMDRGIRNAVMNFAVDPRIRQALSGAANGGKAFSWADLERYNIFLRIPADKVEVWGPVVNLMYAQLITYLMRRPEKYSPKGRSMPHVLLLLDEFPRLGKLEAILPAVTTLRSKGVTICPVIQSLAQLDAIYGRDERRIILDNCQFKLVFGAGDPDTQAELSRLVGKRICRRHSVSEQRGRKGKRTGSSVQISETSDWLIQPHEWASMRDVVLSTPYGTVRVDKFDRNKTYENPKKRFLLGQQ